MSATRNIRKTPAYRWVIGLCIVFVLVFGNVSQAFASTMYDGTIMSDSTTTTVKIKTTAPQAYFQNGEKANPRVNTVVNGYDGIVTISGYDLSVGFQTKNIKLVSESPLWKTLDNDTTWAVLTGVNADNGATDLNAGNGTTGSGTITSAGNSTITPAKLAWRYDTTYGGYILDAKMDGSTDVAVSQDLVNIDPNFGPVLTSVRGGTPVKFTTTVPGYLVFCVGKVYLNGQLVASKSNCDGVNVQVTAGTIEIKDTTGPTGGFRWTLNAGTGWRVTDTRNTCPPLDGLCWEKKGADYSWYGATDGSADVHQASMAEVLDWVRKGGVVDLYTTVPMQVIDTCHILIQVLDKGGNVFSQYERHNCELTAMTTAIKVPAGHLRLSKSTSDAGGWRLSPWFGYGWRSDDVMPGGYKFVELQGPADPAIDPVVKSGATTGDTTGGTITVVKAESITAPRYGLLRTIWYGAGDMLLGIWNWFWGGLNYLWGLIW